MSNKTISLSDEDLNKVAGGSDDKTRQMQDMTNNKAVTAQKNADKMDAYIRS